MDSLWIEETEMTPQVSLDPVMGQIEFRGRSVPNEAEEFFKPISQWLEKYSASPAGSTRVVIAMQYFNISSSKQLLQLLYRLDRLHGTGHAVTVEWHYGEDDVDMYEVGHDYAFMVKMPFEFVATELRVEMPVVEA